MAYDQFGRLIADEEEMTSVQIFEEINKIALKHLMLNDDAMNQMQLFGYNGFKRMHRCKSKEFFCWHIGIENDSIDKYRTKIDDDIDNSKYLPTSFKDHLYSWDNILLDDIKKLAVFINKYRAITGITYGIAEDMMKCFVKSYEKTGRWIKRFEETQWGGHDCHIVDDKLHNKYKEIEEGE